MHLLSRHLLPNSEAREISESNGWFPDRSISHFKLCGTWILTRKHYLSIGIDEEGRQGEIVRLLALTHASPFPDYLGNHNENLCSIYDIVLSPAWPRTLVYLTYAIQLKNSLKRLFALYVPTNSIYSKLFKVLLSLYLLRIGCVRFIMGYSNNITMRVR